MTEAGSLTHWGLTLGGPQWLQWSQLCFVPSSFSWTSRSQLLSSTGKSINSKYCTFLCWHWGHLHFSVSHLCFSPPLERLWVPPGSIHGGGHAWCVLFNGLALVRSCHRTLNHPRQQPKAWIRVLGSRGAAQIPRNQRAALYRPHDLHPHGLLCLHDICAEGQTISFSYLCIF